MYSFKDFMVVNYTQTGDDQLDYQAYKRKRDMDSGVIEEDDDFEPHMMYDPKTGKSYKANKPEDHKRMAKLGYTHEPPEKTNEAMTMQQRQKAKQTFRKNKMKIQRGREKAKKRLADTDKLKARARKQARNLLVKKLIKDKDKGDLSFGARQSLEKQIDKKKGAIDRIAKKLLPQVRKADRAKFGTSSGKDGNK